MNILMIASDNNMSSGAFNSMVVLSRKLIDAGNNVLVTVPYEGTGTELLQENDIPYKLIKSYSWIIENNVGFLKKAISKLKFIVKSIYNFIPYFKYKKIISENDIDIVHINTSWTYVAAKSAISKNTKLVWHLREFLEEDQNVKICFRNNGYKLINKSDKIVCISNKIYNKYENIFDKERLEVIYNGLDVQKYYIKDRKIFENEQINLLFIGGITEKKGAFELCEAVGKFQKLYNYNIKLNLVGKYTDEAKEKVEKIKEKYNASCINLCGIQKDTMSFYSKSDIVFMCSTSEAFGRVTVEAMLSGALVIGANSAATVEIINDSENGLLYEVNNTDDLAEKIKYAIENKNKMKEIAKKGQEDAKEKFSAQMNADNVFKMYKEILR